MIELFGNISGLQLNNSKTEALWTGANDESDLKLRPEKNLKWSGIKIKALGVWLSADPDLTGVLKLQRQVEKEKGNLRLLEAA